MDSRQADLLQTIDPAALGQRIKNARVARGLTQAELAGAEVSTGYVSRIESGLRRPNSKVLAQLAARLDTSIEELLGGVSPSDENQVRLTLDFAELALETGDAASAAEQAAAAIKRAEELPLTEYAERGHFLHARALEALGELDDAILELEPLTRKSSSGQMRLTAGIALSRCYRESGDLARAVEVADRLLEEIEDTPLEATDVAVQLTATLAAAHWERGDTGEAIRVSRKAVVRAEKLNTPLARASAYWNASIMESERGDTGNAVQLAEQALALLSEGGSGRNLARLRLELGIMQLDVRPPQISDAEQNLRLAAQGLREASGGQADTTRVELGLAKARLFAGDWPEALLSSTALYASTRDRLPIVGAGAKLVEGQAWAAMGNPSDSLAAYRQAAALLTGIGADRSVAELWYQVARLLEEAGDSQEALKAYRSAAVSAGLRMEPHVTRITQEVDA